MITPDPRDDLQRLGLRPGAGLDDLKAAWRRAVSDLHPDRRGDAGSPELAAVNAAFRRLQAFHRRHGRLPGPAEPRPPVAVSGPASPPRRGRWGIAATVLAIAVFVAWPQMRPTGAGAPSSPDVASAVGPVDAWPGSDADTATSAPLGRRGERIELGTSAEDVERLAGPPILRSAERWQYGPSEVRFAEGVVSGWHSSPLRPLPVATDSSGSAID